MFAEMYAQTKMIELRMENRRRAVRQVAADPKKEMPRPFPGVRSEVFRRIAEGYAP